MADGVQDKKIDEVSEEAMLSKAGVNWEKARILIRHIKQFCGRSLFISEKKQQAYFGNNNFPLEVDHELLPIIR
jgi:hypothetical protein